MIRRTWLLPLLAVVGCSKGGGGAVPGAGTGSAGSPAAPKKTGGGFSASLRADLAKEGVTTPGSAGSATAGSGATAGSAATASSAAMAVGSGAMAGSAGSGAPAMGSAAKAGSGAMGSAAKPASAGAVATGSAAKPAGTGAVAMGSAAKPAGTGTIEMDSTPPPAPTGNPADAINTGATPATTGDPEQRAPVKVSRALAAIKLDLDPDWFRDLGEPATISFVLRVPRTNAKRLFVFHYGYEDPQAPTDHDAYMKWLADRKILHVTLNRQHGSAWYLEGTDATGAGAFRTLVTFGGKQLICYGSLYKNAAFNPLGDLRDKVVMAAKKICETLAL